MRFEANQVSARGEAILELVLDRLGRPWKRLVTLDHQLHYGDYVLDTQSVVGDLFIELKTEETWTGNLIYELYSNEPERKLGWGGTLTHTHLLCWLFLDVKRLVLVDFPSYQEVSFAPGSWGFLAPVHKSPATR